MKLNDTIQTVIDGAKSGLKNCSEAGTGQPVCEQRPNNKYACFMTSLFMYFRTRYKNQADVGSNTCDALKTSGAITDKFYIKAEANKGDIKRFCDLACRAAEVLLNQIRKSGKNALELLLKTSLYLCPERRRAFRLC